jgi:hypothetical protein
MTAQEYQADAIERAGAYLAHFIATTAPDRHDWVPQVDGAAGLRSALDQVAECIAVNRIFAALLAGDTPSPPAPDAPRPFTDADDARAQLLQSAVSLAAVVRTLTDGDLAREFVTRRGPVPGAAAIEIPYRNMQYHAGQINQLQLLYGDAEFHSPPLPPRAR